MLDHTAIEAPVDVTAATLEKIVEYVNHHQGVDPGIPEKPLRSKIMKEVCQEWDAQFIDKIGENRQELYDLILVGFLFLFLRETDIFSLIGCQLHGYQMLAPFGLCQSCCTDQRCAH